MSRPSSSRALVTSRHSSAPDTRRLPAPTPASSRLPPCFAAGHLWRAEQVAGRLIDSGVWDYEVLGAALAVVGVLLWIHRDLKADIRALYVRIDNILLADRGPRRDAR